MFLRPCQQEGTRIDRSDKHARELGHGDAHGSLQAILPVVGDGAAVDTLDVQLRERAGHAVKACRQYQRIDLDMAFARAQTGLRHLLDRVLIDVDDIHVVLIDDLVEALLQ